MLISQTLSVQCIRYLCKLFAKNDQKGVSFCLVYC
jgi:hypothetical protein